MIKKNAVKDYIKPVEETNNKIYFWKQYKRYPEFCLQEPCQPNASTCPKQTTCREQLSGDEVFRCYCSDDAELSEIGQCVEKSQPLPIIKQGTIPFCPVFKHTFLA